MIGKVCFTILLVFLTYVFSYLVINVSVNFIYLLITVFFAANFFFINIFISKSKNKNIELDNLNSNESANEHPIIASARQRLGKD